MKISLINLAVVSAFIVPVSANAVEVAGDALNVYGKVHLSIDQSDNDKASPDDVSGLNVSSNSSRLGFKGKHKMDNGMAAFYKYESTMELDQGAGSWLSRNAYLGLKGSFGSLLAGHRDTPFKDVGSKWGMFGDSVADRRAILGASAIKGNKMNNRAKNAIMYSNTFGPVQLKAMYSTDAQDSNAGHQDNTNNDMTSVSLSYHGGPLRVAIAQESWSNLSGFGGVDGLRVAAKYKAGATQVGAIYESLTADTTAHMERDAYGVNASYKAGNNTFKLQYLVAGDYKGVSDSGGSQAAIGVYNKMDKQTQVYAVYVATSNDNNAQFQAVDGGHGDEVKTDLGGSPSALSVGMIYKF